MDVGTEPRMSAAVQNFAALDRGAKREHVSGGLAIIMHRRHERVAVNDPGRT